MKYLWRLQQTQMIVGVFFWSLTLAGIFFEYFKPIFVNLGLINSSQVGLGLLILIIMVAVSVLIIGYFYDKVFKLWTEKRVVDMERNIFFKTKLSAKEIVHWQYYQITLLKSLKLHAQAEFFNIWNERVMEEDKILRDDVAKIAKWVNSYDLRPKDDRWLRTVKDELDKRYGNNNSESD